MVTEGTVPQPLCGGHPVGDRLNIWANKAKSNGFDCTKSQGQKPVNGPMGHGAGCNPLGVNQRPRPADLVIVGAILKEVDPPCEYNRRSFLLNSVQKQAHPLFSCHLAYMVQVGIVVSKDLASPLALKASPGENPIGRCAPTHGDLVQFF